MRTSLLYLFLSCCILVLSFQKLKAAGSYTVTALTATNINAGSAALNNSQTGLVTAGFQIANTSTTTSFNLTGLTFTYTGTAVIGSIFPSGGFTLYSYTGTGANATWPGATATGITAIATIATPAASMAVTFTSITVGTTTATKNVYFFLVANFVDNVTSSTTTNFNINLTTITASGTPTRTGANPLADITYTISSPVTLGTATTTGLTSGTISASTNGMGILGFSVTTGDDETITSMLLTASPALSSGLGNYKLYRNSTNSFSGTTLTQVSGVTFNTTSSTTLTITGLKEDINTTTEYYFVVADYTLYGSAAGTYTLNATSVSTAASTFTAGAPVAGRSLTFGTNPVTFSGGNTGLQANPLTAVTTGTQIAILGFKAVTTANETFTSFQFNSTQPTGTIGTYFSSIKLISSTSNVYGSGTLTTLATVTTGLNTTSLTITASSAVNTATKYYYIVGTYIAPTTPGTFELSFISASTSASNFSYAEVDGTSYNVGPAAYDWVGGTATGGVYLWTTPANWNYNGAAQSTSYPGNGAHSTAAANIGLITAYTGEPTIPTGTSLTVATLNLGYSGTQDGPTTAYPYGIEENMYLTVNGSLTVSGDVTQVHNNSTQTSDLNQTITNIEGTGTLTCSGNFYVGDAITDPVNGEATTTELSAQINQLTITGNLILNSNGNSNSGFTLPGICYPWFSVDGGKTTIKGQVQFAANNSPQASAVDIYNPGGIEGITASAEIGHPDYGLFTADNTGDAASTLELQNATPIAKADHFFVYFTNGGGAGTTIFDATGAQTVYSANEPSVTTSATYINAYNYANPTVTTAYNNLQLSGGGTQTVDGVSTLATEVVTSNSGTTTNEGTATSGVTVGGNFTTSATLADFAGNAPLTVTGLSKQTAGTWTMGSGTLTATGALEFAGGTFNGGSSPLTTVSNYCLLDAGSEVVNFGSSTTQIGQSITQNGGTLNFGSGAATIANSAAINAGTMNGSTGTIGITVALQEQGGDINCGTGALTIGGAFQLVAGTFTGDLTAAGTVNVGGAFTCNGTYLPTKPGTFNPGIGVVNFKNSYDNESIFTYAAGTINFVPTATTQSLKDGSTNGTQFNIVTFGTGTATQTISMTAGTGNFSVISTGKLTMAAKTTLSAGTTTTGDASGAAAYLTLASDVNGAAYLDIIPSTSSITGNVNVQRYLTGNSNLNYRGYRLLSSPVNVVASAASATGKNYIGLSTIAASKKVYGVTTYGTFVAGPGLTGINYLVNPTMYFYNETKALNNSSFLLGKNVGVNSYITGASANIKLIDGVSYSMPAGNGYLIYYIGSTQTTTGITRPSGSTAYVPDNAVITNMGFLNQQNIKVYPWFSGAATLSCSSTVIPNTGYWGYNMMGNPYAASINLNKLYTENTNGTLNSDTKLSSNFYELYDKSPNQGYIVYSATGGYSDPNYSQYIASGQGFMAVVTGTGQALTFAEDQKVSNQVTGGAMLSAPPVNIPVVNVVKHSTTADTSAVNTVASHPARETVDMIALNNSLSGMHVDMRKDSVTYQECGIYFSSNWADTHDINDADYFSGTSPQVYMSSATAEGIQTAINKLGDYSQHGKRVKLYVQATTDGLYHLEMPDIQNIDTTIFIFG